MVENQCGLTDIVQSTIAKVTVRRVDQQPAAGQLRQLADQRRIAGRDPARPTTCQQQLADADPDDEIEHRRARKNGVFR